ncbi:hypothetical protein ACIOHC_11405 [Streptomyces sp. NPDC088252]|uniref:hypothetical protein n=1 Tax=unclassified Streptomyces TaxID=2593676 RepID=UPI0037FBA969
MNAADHLREAIDFGCTRDDHDHVAMHRAEVLAEAADAIVAENDRVFWATTPGKHWAADLLRRMADESSSAAQLARFEDARHTLQRARQVGEKGGA